MSKKTLVKEIYHPYHSQAGWNSCRYGPCAIKLVVGNHSNRWHRKVLPIKDLAKMMVGRSVSFNRKRRRSKKSGSANFAVVGRKPWRVSLRLKSYLLTFAQVVIGIAGIDGNGQSELIPGDYRTSQVKSGSIKIKGTRSCWPFPVDYWNECRPCLKSCRWWSCNKVVFLKTYRTSNLLQRTT